MTLASYTYNDLGQQTAKSVPDITSGNQTYAYNIRGWLTNLGSANTEVLKQTLYYQTGATTNRWNGNISHIDWSGMTGAGKTRTYNYTYDNANRLTTANYTATRETEWFTVNGMLYDPKGNITKLVRRNQMTASTYGEVDNLTYTYQTNSNRLSPSPNSHEHPNDESTRETALPLSLEIHQDVDDEAMHGRRRNKEKGNKRKSIR